VLDQVLELIRQEGEEWQVALAAHAKRKEAERLRMIEQERKMKAKKKIGFEF
jgi:hypothetical protein